MSLELLRNKQDELLSKIRELKSYLKFYKSDIPAASLYVHESKNQDLGNDDVAAVGNRLLQLALGLQLKSSVFRRTPHNYYSDWKLEDRRAFCSAACLL